MLNTNQTTKPVPTLNYRQMMIQREQERLDSIYSPDAAVRIQAEETVKKLDEVLDAQEQAGHENVVKLFNFNECETCGRDYNDEACGHRRADFYRDES